jgi:hypothetical protein
MDDTRVHDCTYCPHRCPGAGSGRPCPPSKETEQFRAKHEADYQRGAASNTIVLPKTVPPTIGRLIVTADHVRFEPAAGAPVRLQDLPVTSAIDLKSDESGSRCGR